MKEAKDTMISTGAAAALLGRDRRTIRRMIADKRLRSYGAPNGEHRFRLADVKALVGETDSQRNSAAGGSSPALKNREDSLKELSLELQERRLQRKIKGFDEQVEQEEAERQAAVEQEQQREAEERARARREEEERQREHALETWRTEMLDLFVRVPDGAPAALQAAFLEKAREALARFDCQQPTHIVQALLVAIQEESFGLWQCQSAADARNAWIQEQTEQVWPDLSSSWRWEGLGSAGHFQQNSDALCQTLRLEVARALQNLTHDSSSAALHQARRHALDRALQPHRQEKELLAVAQSATRELRPYLRQLRDTAWLHCEQNYLEILAGDIEPRLLAFLQAHGRKETQLTPCAARQLLEDFVLRDLGLL